MNKLLWAAWVLLSVMMLTYFGYKLWLSDDKSDFVIGPASHGHYQIEMACESCHADAFGAGEVLQEACVNCHEAELKAAHDSHPKKKFTDPRNADLLEVIDARYCVSCHVEHQQERTAEMGLTLPDDYCFHCHETVGEERPSHQDLAFDSCATAGCHNFHDNRALYEDFLVENAGKSWLQQISQLNTANYAKLTAKPPSDQLAKQVELNAKFADKSAQHADIHQQWLMSQHATAQIECAACHVDETTQVWSEKPGIEQCQTCHENEVQGFTDGKHGMRLSDKLSLPLSPMTPSLSRLEFHADVAHQELSCNSCHNVHELSTQVAAAESCLTCHADQHSQSFNDSPHGQLWQQELDGAIKTGEGVSCATCHLPRVEEKINGEIAVRVEHNQNWNLRPNEKMIRPVCIQCHSLEFSIDALADEALILNNFKGKPKTHIPSVDWALKRVQQ